MSNCGHEECAWSSAAICLVAERAKWQPRPRQPYRCPVCEGRGTVPAGFYSDLGAGTSMTPEKCQSCGGTGYVVV